MTGMEALREAARREAARVYGQTLREHRADPAPARPAARPTSGSFERDVEAWRAQGNSIAEIALRLGRSRARVADVVHRIERAS